MSVIEQVWGWGVAAFIAIVVATFAFQLYVFFFHRRWRRSKPHTEPVAFLNGRMAVRPTVLGHAVPTGYRLACLYYGSGLIDRTRTLDQGFPYDVIDEIPLLGPNQVAPPADLNRLIDARARDIVARAERERKRIRLFWSGGIDSTTACIALMRATARQPEVLEIAYTRQSEQEYRAFLKKFVRKHPKRKKLRTVSEALDPAMVLVTGEHGDQIFGSVKAATFQDAELHKPWGDILPAHLAKSFATPKRADEMLRYLEPQVARCPFPVTTVFEYLWWCAFSMKWQAVHLRLAAAAPEAAFVPVRDALEHFFRTPDFQRWSLANPDKRIRSTWATYKWPLKDYIFAATADRSYRDEKTKEPSLRGLIPGKFRGRPMAIDAAQARLFQFHDPSLRKPQPADGDDGSGITIEFHQELETPLWDDLDGDGE